MEVLEISLIACMIAIIFLLGKIADKIDKVSNHLGLIVIALNKNIHDTENSVTSATSETTETEEYPYDLEEYAKEVSEREEHVQSLVDEIASYRNAHKSTATPPQVDSSGLYDYTPELFIDDVEIMTDSREVELEKRAKLW